MKYFEDIAIGEVTQLGDFTFSAETIKRFANAYDPQPFHIDEDAASKSPYGGLIASGWHVASIWMKLMVAHWQREKARLLAAGCRVPEAGPSPGFRNMVWARPVRPGDTMRYRVEIIARKESTSRPEWGLIFMRCFGDNQRGEAAFQFDGIVFCKKRGL